MLVSNKINAVIKRVAESDFMANVQLFSMIYCQALSGKSPRIIILRYYQVYTFCHQRSGDTTLQVFQHLYYFF